MDVEAKLGVGAVVNANYSEVGNDEVVQNCSR
jgi:hypothetical protein